VASFLLSKSVKIKIFKFIILLILELVWSCPVVVHNDLRNFLSVRYTQQFFGTTMYF
jgi:hypothetical protein